MPGILTLQKTAEDQYIVTAASGVITDNTITD